MMAFAMLHLWVTPGAAACVDHGAMAAHHGATSLTGGRHPAHGHDAHASGGAAERSSAPPCDVPAQPSCCSVMAGCATVGLASHSSPATAVLPDVAPRHEALAEGPMSGRAAPEPPPPKR
jgi:hypothetical protein